jgi:hypothetical protein
VGKAYAPPVAAQDMGALANAVVAPPVRMRGVYSGTEYRWSSLDGSPDLDGRWWNPSDHGDVAFASLTNVSVIG